MSPKQDTKTQPNPSQKPKSPGCDEFDPGSLSIEQALVQILNAIPTPKKSKRVRLRKSLGRVLAQDIHAPFDVPNHTNSAMDGYAFNGKALNSKGLAHLNVIGSAFAGSAFTSEVRMGQTVKIMTGAIMPKGCDTVVMQEYIKAQDDGDSNRDGIQITKLVKAGQNVRYAGEDVLKGGLVLKAGRKISSADLGLLASMGLAKILVFKRPRVAFFSNGDEVRKVGEPLGIGEVYDSNRHTLYAMLNRAGVKGIDLGVVGDEYDAIKKVMIKGDKLADMVITSAGASVGEADYIYDILTELGQVNVWKLAIKPGRPLAFGALQNSVFFGLPGNPVSVMTTFALCVRPALMKMSGEANAANKPALLIQAKTQETLRKRPGRKEFQRATAYNNAKGELLVHARKYQGSGVLSSMADANCFIVLDLESQGVKAGELVDIILFSDLF